MNLISNEETSSAGKLFSDQNHKFGMEFPKTRSEIKRIIHSPPKVSSPKHSHDRRSSTISEKSFSSSKSSKGIPQRRSVDEPAGLHSASDLVNARLETGAIRTCSFKDMGDEAVIRVLALAYKYDNPEMSGLDCCKHNRNAALDLGLLQRAALWAAMGVLLPQVSNAKTVLPMSKRLLGNILSELLDQGDCQSFVVCCEILRREKCLESVSISRLQEGYLAYIGIFYMKYFAASRLICMYVDLLSRFKLYEISTSLLKNSEDAYLSRLSKSDVMIYTSCSDCGKEIPEGLSAPWCSKCRKTPLCSLCAKPVRGLLHWCPICSHGGHVACMKLWFSRNDTCATGCGHSCIPTHME